MKVFSIIHNKVSEAMKDYGMYDNFFDRSIATYFIISAYFIILGRSEDIDALDEWQTFTQKYTIYHYCIAFIIVFLLISIIYKFLDKENHPVYLYTDQLLLIICTLIFSLCIVWNNDNFFIRISISIIALLLIIHSYTKTKVIYFKSEKYSIKKSIISVITISLFLLLYVSITAVAQHKTFMTTCFDMGIFVQMYHSLANNFTAITTCERNMPISHFYIHSSYILYILVPIYKLFPYVKTLIVSQVVITLSGIIPLFLIAKNRKFNGIQLILISIIFLFSNGILAPCYYDFHENAFLPPLLLWCFYSIERKKYTLFYIMSFLVCIVKEDAPLYIFFISLYLFFEDKEKTRVYALLASIISIVYLLFITNWLTQNGDGSIMTFTRFENLIYDENSSLINIIINTISNPAHFISLFLNENTLEFFIDIFLPLLFIPFFTKKFHRYILLLPFLIMHLIIGSGYYYAAELGYQYSFGTTTILIYLFLININDFSPKMFKKYLFAAASVSIITSCSYISGYYYIHQNYETLAEAYNEIEDCLDSIPKNYSVRSDNLCLPHIADRDEIYLFSEEQFETRNNQVINIKNIDNFDFYVLINGSELTEKAIPILENSNYIKYAECNGTLIYCKKELMQ
ncbi:MAG: DUF2079 domain-containing protein [Lachnospiraceae bacterium]|nr:DUF2079 domain-containing protein [Lachnospiraceae bacterium]